MGKIRPLSKQVSPFAEQLARSLVEKRKYDSPSVSSLISGLGHTVTPQQVFAIRQKMGIPPVNKHGGGKQINPEVAKLVSEIALKGERNPRKIIEALQESGKKVSDGTVRRILRKHGFEPEGFEYRDEQAMQRLKQLTASFGALSHEQRAEQWGQLQKQLLELKKKHRLILSVEGRRHPGREGITEKEQPILDQIGTLIESLEALEPFIHPEKRNRK